MAASKSDRGPLISPGTPSLDRYPELRDRSRDFAPLREAESRIQIRVCLQ